MIVPLSSHAQNTSLSPTFHSLHQLSVEDGLSDNMIKSLYSDSFGFLWVGTESGLKKYDGVNFESFEHIEGDSLSLTDNRINAVLEYKQGMYLFGSSYGLNHYDIFKHQVMRIEIANSEFNGVLKKGHFQSILRQENGDFILLTKSDGAFILNQDFKNIRRIASNITTMEFDGAYQDTNKITWIGSSEGLVKLDENSQSKLLLPIEGIISDIIAYHHELVICTNSGLIVFNSENETHTKIESFEDIFGKQIVLNIFDGCKLNDHQLLLGLDGSGLAIYDMQQKKIDNNVIFKNLSGNNIVQIAKDKNNTMWIGTHIQGVNYFNSHTDIFSFLPNKLNNEPGSLQTSVSSFEKVSEDRYLVGTDGNGLLVYYPNFNRLKRAKEYALIKDLMPSQKIIDIKKIGEAVFFATYGDGIIKYDYAKKTASKVSLDMDKIKFIHLDSKDRIWIGTYFEDIIVLPKDDFINNDFSNQKSYLQQKGGGSFLEDINGSIWIGTYEGLYKFDEVNDTFKKIESIRTANKGLYVTDMTSDLYGNIWVGTSGKGVYKLSQDGIVSKHLDKETGLTDNLIESICDDRFGNIWITSKKGLNTYVESKGTIKNYIASDHIPSIFFYLAAKEKLENGKIMFGSGTGILKVDPGLFSINNQKPPVYITKLEIAYDSTHHEKTTYHLLNQEKITLNHTQNSFKIEFIALNLLSPRRNQYKYILKGFDKNQKTSRGTQNFVNYTNIPPGEYVFKVKAANNDGIWNYDGKAITIIIRPPFWMRWWFISICVIIGALVLFGIYYLRVYQLQKQKAILEEKVLDRTLQIETQKHEIELQRDQILKKSKDVEESLRVSQILQQAVLPNDNQLKLIFDQSFLLFKPKHQIGGDFHLFKKLNDGKIVIAVADCSGHGVSGALQTMIASTYLLETINTHILLDPGDILERLNHFIIEIEEKTFEAHYSGIDISLVIYDPSTKILFYSGARNPIYLVRKNEPHKIERLEVDTFSIGLMYKKMNQVFTTSKIVLEKGDRLYFFTDGYSDQHGGKNFEKLKNGKFKELILNMQTKSMYDQKGILTKELSKWQGKEEQTDDILVLGIEIDEPS